jgi:hypothetical protein
MPFRKTGGQNENFTTDSNINAGDLIIDRAGVVNVLYV